MPRTPRITARPRHRIGDLSRGHARSPAAAGRRARCREDDGGENPCRCDGHTVGALQCYEGLTAAEALYDWNYQRQLLSIRLAESRNAGIDESDLYTEEYLVDRPILHCVRYRGPVPLCC